MSATITTMSHKIEFERETDGRWIAEVPSVPGAMAYGKTKQEAEFNALAIAIAIFKFQGQSLP
jgi:predicted RNase H-like HicB family nuclease